MKPIAEIKRGQPLDPAQRVDLKRAIREKAREFGDVPEHVLENIADKFERHVPTQEPESELWKRWKAHHSPDNTARNAAVIAAAVAAATAAALIANALGVL